MTAPGYAVGYLENVDVGPEIIEYIVRIESTFEEFGGRWLVHGTQPEVVEGPLPGALVVIEFPSLAHARSWYESPAYQDIADLRVRHSDSRVALLEGVPHGYRAQRTADAMNEAIGNGAA
ncbi:DUF1330 domain-containing protein [Gordonia neofelifaecis]|uniref:DUF1330 domain-containing protein n=1 Tax=Gordonia neofelifaecis NRRL B-59395 TaxID=644548 RepID=F1YP64_9ACTN|nr:DUF1330 domain-containing protein [Gordonia neofelifaecis]EGD53513.1 hypothetical protein SCNU_18352 [Gordonia neofelifaecis NRRL B-59395]